MSNIKPLDKEIVNTDRLMSRPGHGWASAGLLIFIIGLITYILVEEASNIIDVNRGFEITLAWMPVSMVFLVVSFGLSIVAVIKAKRFMKILPILIMPASVVLFLLALLAYSFSLPTY